MVLPIRCQPHRRDDVLVAGAPAKVAGESASDPFGRRVRIVPQKRLHRHQYPWRAEAALQRVGLVERLLERMERVWAGRHALDSRDAAAVRLHREHQARSHRLPVQLHRARAAHAVLAAKVSPGERGVVADEVREQQARLDLAHDRAPVDLDRDSCDS